MKTRKKRFTRKQIEKLKNQIYKIIENNPLVTVPELQKITGLSRESIYSFTYRKGIKLNHSNKLDKYRENIIAMIDSGKTEREILNYILFVSDVKSLLTINKYLKKLKKEMTL